MPSTLHLSIYALNSYGIEANLTAGDIWRTYTLECWKLKIGENIFLQFDKSLLGPLASMHALQFLSHIPKVMILLCKPKALENQISHLEQSRTIKDA